MTRFFPATFYATSNRIEAGVWIAMGLGVLVWALAKRRPGHLATSLVLVVFGFSDIAEAAAGTGTWWRPWWLLAWKAACVMALGAIVTSIVRARRRRNPREDASL